MQTVSTMAELEAAVAAPTFVLEDFFATWCGPCKMVAPALPGFEAEFGLHVVKVDVDQFDGAAEFGIKSVPTFQLYREGQELARQVGGNPTRLQAWLKSELGA